MSTKKAYLTISTLPLEPEINQVMMERVYEFSYTAHEIVYEYLTMTSDHSPIDAVNDSDIRRVIRMFFHQAIVEFTGMRLSNLVSVSPGNGLGLLLLELHEDCHRHFPE